MLVVPKISKIFLTVTSKLNFKLTKNSSVKLIKKMTDLTVILSPARLKQRPKLKFVEIKGLRTLRSNDQEFMPKRLMARRRSKNLFQLLIEKMRSFMFSLQT